MRTALAAIVLGVTTVAAAPEQGIDPAVRGVLTRYLQFGALELGDLESGKIVRHAIETGAPGEIAVAGAIRVQVSKAQFLARLRDIVRFKRGEDILQIGRFSNPPAPGDLSGLTVDVADFNPRACTIGDCDVRLPADAIKRVEHELDPNAPNLQEQAAALFKQLLFENVTAYVSGAGRRMAQLDGDEVPIRPIDEFASMLKNAPAIGALVPGLPDHMRDFPHHKVPGAEDFLYWSKERFGMAPFITVTHVTIVCATPRTCTVTTKDVYSSRYLDASLALTVATDAGASSDAIYLVYANRTRANALKGRFSGLRHAIAERRARGGLEESLRAIKMQLEKGP